LEGLRLSQLLYSASLSDKRVASATLQTHFERAQAAKMPSCCLFASLQKYRQGEAENRGSFAMQKRPISHHDVKISLANFPARATLSLTADTPSICRG
jgi:hypothetical protein